MTALLKLRQAARLIGVSPGRLYRAIADGRLAAALGGGPGKLTLVSLEALQTFCRSEGLRMPEKAETLERPERAERSGRSDHGERSIDDRHDLDTLARHYLARVMAQQSQYFDRFLKEELTHLVERVVDQVIERLEERLTGQRAGPHERSIACTTLALTDPKAAVLTRLRAMQAEGLSLRTMANRLNAEGVPTLSGKGRWQQGTIGKLVAQAKGERASRPPFS
jgi:hypothetical protein